MKIPKRLFRLPFRTPDDVRADVADEFAFHLDMRTEELVRAGMSEADARAQAGREFGRRAAGARTLIDLGEHVERRRRATQFVAELRQDAALGVRLLRRGPGFAAVAILTLA